MHGRRVTARVDHIAVADHIVDNDDAAGPRELQRPIEVGFVVRFVGVDKDNIERLVALRGKPW